MATIPGVDFRQLDFLAPEAPQILIDWLGGPADVVLSDMAANATGHKKTDQLRIIDLVELAADFAGAVLAPGGVFLAKVLQGGTEANSARNAQAPVRRDQARQAEGEPGGFLRALSAGNGLSRPRRLALSLLFRLLGLLRTFFCAPPAR